MLHRRIDHGRLFNRRIVVPLSGALLFVHAVLVNGVIEVLNEALLLALVSILADDGVILNTRAELVLGEDGTLIT